MRTGASPRDVATLLAALEDGTHRITELAQREGLTQSTTAGRSFDWRRGGS
jgi:hypothetical protein